MDSRFKLTDSTLTDSQKLDTAIKVILSLEKMIKELQTKVDELDRMHGQYGNHP